MYRSLEEIARYQYWEPFTKEKAIHFAKSCSKVQLDKKGQWIGLAIIADNIFIGDCSIKFDDYIAEIGCNISPDFQGRGYAKETLRLLLITAFNNPSIDNVIAITDSKNGSSIKLMEASGMIRNSEFENHIICKEKECIEYKYTIERARWNNTKNG